MHMLFDSVSSCQKGAEGTILGTPRGHPVGESVQHFFSKARVKLMLMAAALPCLRLFICVSGCLSSPRYLPSWGKLAMHAFLVCLNDSNGSSHACSWLYVCQIVFALASMCARLSMLLPLCVPDCLSHPRCQPRCRSSTHPRFPQHSYACSHKSYCPI
eukprot:scaffold85819_cov24-Tisochrysis_lutea.AAC.6